MISKYLTNIAQINLRRKHIKWFSTNDPNNNRPTRQNFEEKKRQQLKQKQQHDQQEEFKYQKQNRNTIGWFLWRLVFWGSIATFSYHMYLVSYQKLNTQPKPYTINGFTVAAKSTYRFYNDMLEFFTAPPVKKLLADPLHPLVQPKTLVLNLSGTIINTDFVFGKGMTLKRRPGLNQLLNKLGQMYQIVIFTDDDYMFLQNATTILDPRRQYFTEKFGQQCMIWFQGRYIKDLKYLNRQLRNIIVIDRDIDNVKKHPKNVIVLKQFKGQDNDNQLIKLLPLLENLASPQVKDVRKALQGLGPNPQDKFQQIMKQKQTKLTQKTSSGFYSFFTNKK